MVPVPTFLVLRSTEFIICQQKKDSRIVKGEQFGPLSSSSESAAAAVVAGIVDVEVMRPLTVCTWSRDFFSHGGL